ncbi:MAG: ferredoxin [Bacteroidales bacterium]|nr:ferredoxin [Bacteroidales bacterium]MDD2569743.1 ferredoxin [Bacteroidales bacterium]MDD2812881.1 ferredoxin [Bacteroidales bacterium]MDD3384155.1 ferredoxin [Bacteroidales bacterium]MDD3812009.1 ferredoxin [Bacteroidales bacterium]
MDRKKFITNVGRYSILGALLFITGQIFFKRRVSASGQYVWQIDPMKCTQCGRCATECIKTPSAVKCVHAYDLCGYCDLCGGYFKPNTMDLNTGAENQLCPTGAIQRKFVEEPFFEYAIDEKLCNGCGKCVKGCTSFGNGSLHLQIRHDLCDNCNQCAIARVCPSDAIKRVPIENPYLIKGAFTS